MEFDFGIADVATEEVMKIDRTLTAVGHEENGDFKSKMRVIIDKMGMASAVAQELKSPVTSADKLVNSDHMLYLMTEHNTPEHFAVVGIMKMGWKKLYIFNKTGERSEAMVYCLLDFYIHESRQRKGYGKRLIEYMLQDRHSEAKHLAIDKPTKKLLQFMWKHFNLSKLVNQGNNFVIFEEFFDGAYDEENHDTSRNRASAYKCQPMFGRHGAHKHHDTMGKIIQNESNATYVKLKYNQDQDIVDHQFKEVNPHPEQSDDFQIDKDGNSVKRDLKFHHNSLW